METNNQVTNQSNKKKRRTRGRKNKNTHKVFILTCDGQIIPQENWSFSSSITPKFMLTLLVDDNGRDLRLPINPFASFIKNQMLVGDCVVLVENELIYSTIQDFLEIRFHEMNSKPKIDWIARDAEHRRLLIRRVNEMRAQGQEVIFLQSDTVYS